VSRGVPDLSHAHEQTAGLYERAVDELQQAVEHCRVAAEHFRAGVVPRGTAHAWAARGHLLNAETLLDEQAREHASHSVPRAD
jgi:hypothetical protein